MTKVRGLWSVWGGRGGPVGTDHSSSDHSRGTPKHSSPGDPSQQPSEPRTCSGDQGHLPGHGEGGWVTVGKEHDAYLRAEAGHPGPPCTPRGVHSMLGDVSWARHRAPGIRALVSSPLIDYAAPAAFPQIRGPIRCPLMPLTAFLRT